MAFWRSASERRELRKEQVWQVDGIVCLVCALLFGDAADVNEGWGEVSPQDAAGFDADET